MMQHVRSTMGLTLIAAAMTSCAAAPPLDNRPVMQPDAAIGLGYNVLWSTNTALPRGVKITDAAVVDDMLVMVETPRNLVTALAMRDGAFKWRAHVGSNLDRLHTPFGFDEEVMVNSEWQVFHLNPKNGKVTGVSRLEEAVTSGPTLSGGLAIFGGTAGLIYAHNLTAGRSEWSYNMTAGVKVKPAVLDTNVFAADVNGVYALLTTRGEFQWKGRTFGPIRAQPFINNLGIFVPSEDNTMYALDRLSAKDKWKYRATEPLSEDPLVIRTTIYLPIPDRGLVAINAIDGKELWEMKTEAVPVGLIDKGLLLNDRKKLIIVDPQTGTVIHETPTLWLGQVIITDDRSLILISPYGRIMKLDPLP